MPFEHRALDIEGDMPAVYTAFSKKLFYAREIISAYVIEQGYLPLNPFMNFAYYLSDRTDRDLVRKANNSLVKIAEQLWVFGPVADGVLAEIKLAKEKGKPIRYFDVVKDKEILEVTVDEVDFEEGLDKYRDLL
tara:strand:- start:2126 stop:2527 length:402 start_codon:yes stop_codon:yes gene_type:complete